MAGPIAELADADGHVIEPGDLWVTRVAPALRDAVPEYYRDADGVFHQKIYGLDVGALEVMHGGMRPQDMLASMGLAAAMGQDLGRVFAAADRDRFTILDAPAWTKDGAARLAYNLAHGVGRAVLFPTFMLAGGTFLPHVAPAVCQVYNDWLADDYCGGSGGRLIPVAALPMTNVEAAVVEVRRCAVKGFRAAFVRTNPVNGTRYSDRAFDPVWEAIVDAGMTLGLHPLPMWDQIGTARGYKLENIMESSALGFPMDMMATLYEMMAGGVFDRFPTMPTMILEAGAGWLPSMLERWDEHREMFGRYHAPAWKTPAREVFLRQMMITVEACEEIDIEIALRHLPADHVALASDWPHYDGTPDLVAGFAKASAGIAAADARMLATGTLERWFPSH